MNKKKVVNIGFSIEPEGLELASNEFAYRLWTVGKVGSGTKKSTTSNEEQVKALVAKFDGKALPVMPDHSNNPLDVVGKVTKLWYAEATDTLPAGMNGIYTIFDTPANANLLESLRSKSIEAASVRVGFTYMPSHEIANFSQKLGQEVDGKEVTMQVVEFTDFIESSIVLRGADRLATMFSDDDESVEEKQSAIIAANALVEEYKNKAEAVQVSYDALLTQVEDYKAKLATATSTLAFTTSERDALLKTAKESIAKYATLSLSETLVNKVLSTANTYADLTEVAKELAIPVVSKFSMSCAACNGTVFSFGATRAVPANVKTEFNAPIPTL